MTPPQNANIGFKSHAFNGDLLEAAIKKFEELFEALSRVGKDLINRAAGSASATTQAPNDWASGVNRTLNNWAAGANHTLNDGASAINNTINLAMKKMGETLVFLAEKLIEVRNGVGAPWAAYDIADKWVDAHSLASDIISELQVGVTLKAGVSWQGKGADSYNQKQITQLAALEKFRDVCTDCQNTTAGIGNAGTGFYISLIIPLITVVVTAITTAASAGTGVLTLPAVTAGLAAVTKNTASVVSIITGLIYFIQTTKTEVGRMKSLTYDTGQPLPAPCLALTRNQAVPLRSQIPGPHKA